MLTPTTPRTPRRSPSATASLPVTPRTPSTPSDDGMSDEDDDEDVEDEDPITSSPYKQTASKFRRYDSSGDIGLGTPCRDFMPQEAHVAPTAVRAVAPVPAAAAAARWPSRVVMHAPVPLKFNVARAVSMRELPTIATDALISPRFTLPTPELMPEATLEQRKVEHLMPFERSGCVLPTVKGLHAHLATISCQTAAKLVCGEGYQHCGLRVVVVDCRYSYEFNGGHIRGAVNITLPHVEDQLREMFFGQRTGVPATAQPGKSRTVVLFHCEFSVSRGPKTMQRFREIDRSLNVHPALSYEQVYLINGGYQDFFVAHPELCEPQDYIPMLSKHHCRDFGQIQKIERLEEQHVKKLSQPKATRIAKHERMTLPCRSLTEQLDGMASTLRFP
jgi:rhodanese-related sulfurtransferase